MRKLIISFIVVVLITFNHTSTVNAKEVIDEYDPNVAGVGVEFSDFVDNEIDKEKSEETKKEKKEEASPYENIAITQVSNYVNIRKEPNTDSKILGKIYDNAAATILKTVDGEDGKWYYIKSGSVKGYMKAEFFVTGKKAEKIAKDVGNVLCRTTATTLRLREKASTSSDTLTLLAEDSVYSVLKENVTNKKGEIFHKVLVSESDESNKEDLTGFISADYAEVYVEFEEAISIEEELAEIARQQELERQAERALLQNNSNNYSPTVPNESNQNNSSDNYKSENETRQNDVQSTENTQKSNTSSGTGSAIAAKAQQYAGWLPYVWGGTSLNSGADCSGFVQTIYANYGISVPRTSSAQASSGRSISYESLQPGDLVFYGSPINHVAIYIGDGQICHEANSRRDCVIDSVFYVTPTKYVTYIH